MINEILNAVMGLYYIGAASGTVDYALSEKLRREGRAVKIAEGNSPQKRFNLLMPALFEQNIIDTAIDKVSDLNHPNYKVTIITHKIDPDTAKVAREHIEKMGYTNIDIKEYDYNPRTKASALNHALSDLNYDDFDIIGILDAENWFEGKDVLRNVETYFNNNPDVGAVQVRIAPIYEKDGAISQLAQLSACVEFANLYVLPKKVEEEATKDKANSQEKNGKYDGNLFNIGRMSIKNRFTTAILGGTGCFYSTNVLKELAEIRASENLAKAGEGEGKKTFVAGPFNPYGLVEDFQSSIDIIGKLPGQKKIVYDEDDKVFAYFPNTLRQRLKQETRWSTGKLKSMLDTNVFKLNTSKTKKFELIREYFFNMVTPINFISLGYMAWSIASNYLGLGIPAPDVSLSLLTIPPALYAIVSTSDQVYKTCRFYDKKFLSKDALKYSAASLLNQWIIQPSASLNAYANNLKSYVTGQPNRWEKTVHQKIDPNNTEGLNGSIVNSGDIKKPSSMRHRVGNYFNPASIAFYGLGIAALICAAPLSIPVMALGLSDGAILGTCLQFEKYNKK